MTHVRFTWNARHAGRLAGSAATAVRTAIAAAALLLVALPVIAGAQAAPLWLDAPPARWNTPGAALPAAVPPGVPVAPPCAAAERQAQTLEEEQLASAGWRFLQAWPARDATVTLEGQAVLVRVLLATAGYDGMCRPYNFNGFVFVAGRFAGTLAPAPMVSRTDGVLAQGPDVLAAGRLQADFTRYAPNDPLCCPSRGHTRVIYVPERTPAGWTLAPETIRPVVGLPATGHGETLPVPLGLFALAAGAVAAGALQRRFAGLRPSQGAA